MRWSWRLGQAPTSLPIRDVICWRVVSPDPSTLCGLYSLMQAAQEVQFNLGARITSPALCTSILLVLSAAAQCRGRCLPQM